MDWGRNRFGLVSKSPTAGTTKLMHNRVASIEGWFLYRTSWEDAVEEAQHRNAAG